MTLTNEREERRFREERTAAINRQTEAIRDQTEAIEAQTQVMQDLLGQLKRTDL